MVEVAPAAGLPSVSLLKVCSKNNNNNKSNNNNNKNNNNNDNNNDNNNNNNNNNDNQNRCMRIMLKRPCRARAIRDVFHQESTEIGLLKLELTLLIFLEKVCLLLEFQIRKINKQTRSSNSPGKKRLTLDAVLGRSFHTLMP